jgi:hypothetical protein
MHARHSVDFGGSSTEFQLAGFGDLGYLDLGFGIADFGFIKRIEFLYYQDNAGGQAGVRLRLKVLNL